jgi:hypothetical protein
MQLETAVLRDRHPDSGRAVIPLFLAAFPLCFLFCWLVSKILDWWKADDAKTRRLLHGRAMQIDGQWRVFQEDGQHLTDIDIKSYFDDLPNMRRF